MKIKSCKIQTLSNKFVSFMYDEHTNATNVIIDEQDNNPEVTIKYKNTDISELITALNVSLILEGDGILSLLDVKFCVEKERMN